MRCAPFKPFHPVGSARNRRLHTRFAVTVAAGFPTATAANTTATEQHPTPTIAAAPRDGGIVESPGRNLILTAGHGKNAHGMFVPQYDGRKFAGAQPFGVFPVQEWFRDTRWATDKSANSGLDFAFARVDTCPGAFTGVLVHALIK
jgi:hypothetical protein